MTVYTATDSLMGGTADTYKDADNVAAANEETVAVKSAAEQQLASAFSSIPASADVARGVALNVLLCGSLAGALATSLSRVLQQVPNNDIPPIADGELHAQMKEILETTSREAPRLAEELGKPGINLMRSMLDKEIGQAAALAGKSDDSSRKAFAEHLLLVFEGGYTVGAGSAILDGQSM
jgi:hypothetical protein